MEFYFCFYPVLFLAILLILDGTWPGWENTWPERKKIGKRRANRTLYNEEDPEAIAFGQDFGKDKHTLSPNPGNKVQSILNLQIIDRKFKYKRTICVC